MWKSRGILAALIVSLILGILSGNAAFPADAKLATSAIGSADANTLFTEYDKRKQSYQELETLQAKLEAQLELRNGNRLLTDEEFKTLLDLEAKPQKQDADKQKIEELRALSKQRDQELQALQQKQDATEEEKAKRRELENRLKSVNEALQQDKGKFEKELNTKFLEVNQEVTKDIEAAVAAVAKDEGLAIIFNKSFGAAEFVLYSSVDITDDVLKKLNKK